MTLVLDLGTFVIESDTQTASQLSTEAAALYECLSLDGRDIGAYVIEGPFRFDSIQQRLANGHNQAGSFKPQVIHEAYLSLYTRVCLQACMSLAGVQADSSVNCAL